LPLAVAVKLRPVSPLIGETGRSFTATASGSYAVEVTQNGCTDTSECYLIIWMGIMKNDFGEVFKLYPNPMKDEFVIELGQVYNDVIVKVKSITGQMVTIEKYESSDKLNCKLVGQKGLYLVEIFTGEGKKATVKIIKE
ncbi:MAG: T9SS type A sorting domain-containing protein, partial [Bacteroidales bacterium]